MSVPYRVVYLTWAKRVSLATTLIVVVLSWINAVKIPYIIVRGVFSFGVIYLLLVGILHLFEKTAPQEPEESQEPPGPQTPQESQGSQELPGFPGFPGTPEFPGSQGSQEHPRPQGPQDERTCSAPLEPPLQDTKYAGQVAPGLNEMPNTERQIEAVRRMGWDDS